MYILYLENENKKNTFVTFDWKKVSTTLGSITSLSAVRHIFMSFGSPYYLFITYVGSIIPA